MSGSSSEAYEAAIGEVLNALVDADTEKALIQCEAARAIRPEGARVMFLLGLIAFTMRDYGHAIPLFEQGHQLHPSKREFADALSAMYARVGQLSDSLFYTKVATTLESDPQLQRLLPEGFDDFESNMEKASLSSSYIDASVAYLVRDYEKAIKACEKELALNPDNLECLELFGKVLVAAQEHDRAIEVLIKGVQADVHNTENWLNLGDALLASGRPTDALEMYENALEVDPELTEARKRIALNLVYLNDELWSNYPRICEEISAKLDQQVSEASVPPLVDPDGIIHVAFLINEAAITDKNEFLAGLFQNLNPEMYKVFVYQQYIQPHPATMRLKKMVHNWRATYDVDDATMSRIIHNDGIHHIVDMCGMMPGERQELLAANAGCNRISWLGFPMGGTPATADITLSCDETLDVDQRDSAGVDCISMGPALFCYPGGSVLLGEDRRRGPVTRNGFVTFGAFLDLPRLAQSIEVWISVLKQVEGSRLVLGGVENQQRLAPLVAAAVQGSGVEDRVSVLGDCDDLSERSYLLSEVDILLDARRINGMGELCDALWMGVPVVTLRGARRSSRVGASILRAADLSDWVAETPEQYVEIAANLGQDQTALSSWRRSLRAHIEKSALFDARSFIERFGEILQSIKGDKAA